MEETTIGSIFPTNVKVKTILLTPCRSYGRAVRHAETHDRISKV